MRREYDPEVAVQIPRTGKFYWRKKIIKEPLGKTQKRQFLKGVAFKLLSYLRTNHSKRAVPVGERAELNHKTEQTGKEHKNKFSQLLGLLLEEC